MSDAVVWKEYQHRYKVSNHGDVVSLVGPKEKQLRPSVCGRYRSFIISTKDGPKRVLVHRAVYEAFNGPVPEGLIVDHINGDRFDNCLENLQAITQRENIHKGHLVNTEYASPGIRKKNSGFAVVKGFRDIHYNIGFDHTAAGATNIYASCTTEDQAIEMQKKYKGFLEERRKALKVIRKFKMRICHIKNSMTKRKSTISELEALRDVNSPVPLEDRVRRIRELKLAEKVERANKSKKYHAQKVFDAAPRYFGAFDTKSAADKHLSQITADNYKLFVIRRPLDVAPLDDGILYSDDLGTWIVYQNLPKSVRYLGQYQTEREALEARSAAAHLLNPPK
jgi:hypothetical protein